jgi:hypothetical protein
MGGMAAPALAGAPASPGDSTEQVAAIAQSGVVYVTVTWDGYVQYPTEYSSAWSDNVETVFACSGYVADNTGYVVTAGHCADPLEGRKALIEQFLSDSVDNGTITAADSDALLPAAIVAWPVEGTNSGDPIGRTVEVYQQGSASGIDVANGLTATVVENRPINDGDVTLLKVQAPSSMPALQLADSVPEVGAEIAVAGFPASVGDVVDPSLRASFETGKVNALQTSNGVPFLQFDAATSSGMSGGPVVNMQGEVVGTVSFNPSGETQSFNFAAGQETIKALLNRNDVNGALSATDQAFRDGLAQYYAGDYAAAQSSFDAVLAVVPSHAVAQQYKVKVVQARANTPVVVPAPSGNGVPIAVWIAIVAAVVLICAGVAVLLIRRRSADGRAQPPPVPPMPPAGMQAQICPYCGATDPAGSHFCLNCGAPFLDQPPTAPRRPMSGSRS